MPLLVASLPVPAAQADLPFVDLSLDVDELVPGSQSTTPMGGAFLAAGVGIARQPIEIHVNGNERKSLFTNNDGSYDTTIPLGPPGTYRVQAVAPLHDERSPLLTVQKVDRPSPPVAISATYDPDVFKVRVTWAAPTDTDGLPVDSYEIWRYDDGISNPQTAHPVATVPGDTTAVALATPWNQVIGYNVRATTWAGTSDLGTGDDVLMPQAPAPSAPLLSNGNHQYIDNAGLAWGEPDFIAPATTIAEYIIEGQTDFGGFDEIGRRHGSVDPRTWNHGLDWDTRYDHRVIAVNDYGILSLPSNVVTQDLGLPPDSMTASVAWMRVCSNPPSGPCQFVSQGQTVFGPSPNNGISVTAALSGSMSGPEGPYGPVRLDVSTTGSPCFQTCSQFGTMETSSSGAYGDEAPPIGFIDQESCFWISVSYTVSYRDIISQDTGRSFIYC